MWHHYLIHSPSVIQHEESCIVAPTWIEEGAHAIASHHYNTYSSLYIYLHYSNLLSSTIQYNPPSKHKFSRMKPHVSSESSLGNESSRSVGEKLHQVCKAAMVAITTDGSKQSRLLTCNQRLSHHTEDPIRTLMFLGSWSHT